MVTTCHRVLSVCNAMHETSAAHRGPSRDILEDSEITRTNLSLHQPAIDTMYTHNTRSVG